MNKQLWKIKRQPHHMITFSKKTGLAAFSYCQNCGLVALKNERSRKALSKDCIVKEDL